VINAQTLDGFVTRVNLGASSFRDSGLRGARMAQRRPPEPDFVGPVLERLLPLVGPQQRRRSSPLTSCGRSSSLSRVHRPVGGFGARPVDLR